MKTPLTYERWQYICTHKFEGCRTLHNLVTPSAKLGAVGKKSVEKRVRRGMCLRICVENGINVITNTYPIFLNP
jgi:hypothetical protein